MNPAADTWNPAQYDRFRAERSAPFFDLLGMVQPRAGMRVVDLGCGTGELTAELHRRLDASRTLGIDNSEKMLANAAAIAVANLTFERCDLATMEIDANVDLVFSNAAIQWAPDHLVLLKRLTKYFREGAQLAIQVPANDDHITHEAARIVARLSPFSDALKGWTRPTAVLAPEEYAALLYQLGFREQNVRLNVYAHVLDDRESVIEWVKGTLLTDYQRRLPAELWPAFLAAYRETLFGQIAEARPFFYPFKRILFWAKR